MLVLVALCAVAGWAIGLLLRPVVDRVTAERSEAARRRAAPASSRRSPPFCSGRPRGASGGRGRSPPTWRSPPSSSCSRSSISTPRPCRRRMVWAAGAIGVGLLTVASVAAGEPRADHPGRHRGDDRVRAAVRAAHRGPGRARVRRRPARGGPRLVPRMAEPVAGDDRPAGRVRRGRAHRRRPHGLRPGGAADRGSLRPRPRERCLPRAPRAPPPPGSTPLF